jgi:hypothetical protein
VEWPDHDEAEMTGRRKKGGGGAGGPRGDAGARVRVRMGWGLLFVGRRRSH